MLNYETTGRQNIAQNCNTTVNSVDTVKINLRDAVFDTNDNLEACAGYSNAILKFLSGDEFEMPVPSDQADCFSGYADITRERSACVRRCLVRIAEILGIDL